MRARVVVCWCVCALVAAAGARRTGGGGSRSRGSGGYRGGSSTSFKHKTPTGSSTTFLGFERGGSSHSGTSSSGTTHNHGNPFSGSAPPKQTPQSNGPVGFEHFGSGGTHGNQKPIGFDKVNSEVQHKPSNSPPPYPGGSHPQGYPQPGTNQGPPPSYYPGSGGFNDHPPAYPGRPANAPPAYNPAHPPPPGFVPQSGHPGNAPPAYNPAHPPPPGFVPQSGHPGNAPAGYNPYNPAHPPPPGFVPQPGHSSQPGYNFGNPSYQNTQFGYPGHASYQGFGNSYPSNTGSYAGYGGSPIGNSYAGNSFGGSPFGGASHGAPAYPGYNPNNFGYSGNPGYFGQGYHDGYQKKSRFGGLGGLPIPIPIPIPIGGGGFGGFGSGFGGYGGNSYNHHVLDSFIRTRGTKKSSNSSTSTDVFVLNNSTVTPCTTDHFVYDALRVTVLSCTAEFCTAVKVSTSTNRSDTVHSAALTVCFENNVTFSYHGDQVVPLVSEPEHSNFTVCRNVTVDQKNETAAANKSENAATTTSTSTTAATSEEPSSTTAKPDETPNTTTLDAGPSDPTTTPGATPTTDSSTSTTPSSANATSANATSANVTKEVCEQVNCYSVRMCMPAIELVDACNSVDCPFQRTGYQPCVTIKACRSPSVALSTFASLNTTISKIDEYNTHRSVHDAANLTLISYHRPPPTVWTTEAPSSTTSPKTPISLY